MPRICVPVMMISSESSGSALLSGFGGAPTGVKASAGFSILAPGWAGWLSWAKAVVVSAARLAVASSEDITVFIHPPRICFYRLNPFFDGGGTVCQWAAINYHGRYLVE